MPKNRFVFLLHAKARSLCVFDDAFDSIFQQAWPQIAVQLKSSIHNDCSDLFNIPSRLRVKKITEEKHAKEPNSVV